MSVLLASRAPNFTRKLPALYLTLPPTTVSTNVGVVNNSVVSILAQIVLGLYLITYLG